MQTNHSWGQRAASVIVGVAAPVLALASIGVTPAVPHAASGTQLPEPSPQPTSDLVVARGCVVGGAFTTVSPSGVTTAHRTYRLTGPRALLKQLRKDHEGHLEEITGRIQGDFAAPNVVRRKQVGKVGIVVGAGHGGSGADSSRISDTPSIEVASSRHLDDRCPD
jgi:hypothetical protein